MFGDLLGGYMKGFYKKSGIYFDTKVKKGSNNAVTSDAVATAIESGGGGSTDYADLTNKPKINNVELSGNKSLDNLGIASMADLTILSGDVGDLSELTTTEKTSIVGAINEIAGGGGGSSGGLQYKRFTNKQTTSTTTISGASFVSFDYSSVKAWFDTAPTTIHAIIAGKSNGSITLTSIRNSSNKFIMETGSSAVTYEYVGVFYE